VDKLDCADVDAARWFTGYQDRRILTNLSGDDQFLCISSGKRTGFLCNAVRFDTEFFNEFTGEFPNRRILRNPFLENDGFS
jgi:hypothetical protein